MCFELKKLSEFILRWIEVGSRNFKVGQPKHPMSFLLFGGISSKGPSPLVIFNGKLDSNDFCCIFKDSITKFVE